MDEFYKLSKENCLKQLNSNKNGINNEEAQKRLKKYGLNVLEQKKKKSMILKFFEQFKDVMLIILLISSIISGIVAVSTNESFTDSIIILFVVILNAILGLIQENKAEKAIESLKNMSVPYIKAKRDGKIVSIKTEELVPGDIVLLEAGDYVPADLRLIEVHSLKIEESSLTGESLSVEKNADEIYIKDVSIADRKNIAFTGSSIVYGRGEGVVIATAMNTQLGKIAEAISTQKAEITPLQRKMNELSKVLSIAVIIIAIIMFIIGYLQGNQIIDVFMLAISLAVAAIPEGLSAVITITLAVGVQKMAKENAIVRKLSAVEALGSTEVICTDKTGTLTQNKMTVKKLLLLNKIIDVSQEEEIEKLNLLTKNKSEELSQFSKALTLCNDTKYGENNGNKVMIGEPTEKALIEFCDLLGHTKEGHDETYLRIDEIPFDSKRKMMSTLNDINSQKVMYVKGAPESVIEKCTKILENGKIRNIEKQDIKFILNSNVEMAKEALRVLAFAYKPLKKEEKINEEELIFIGLVGMIDSPRKEAKKAVERCFNAGIIPVMITGDNIDTACAIAKELGILKEKEEAITGIELDKLSDDEFGKKVVKYRVYARVSPENKIRIVNAWKKQGKVVAMTGDGVNDAPALKGADIGVGMGITGTEVSKNVSSMVLSDDNFATIVIAVKEGRRIYNNIQNAIAYLLASNLAEMLIVFIATLFNKVFLLPIQILWINLVTDTVPAIALGFEKEEKDIMRRKPRPSREKLLNPFMVARIIIPGIFKALVVFLLYYFVNKNYTQEIAVSCVFITLSTLEILFSSVCRSDKKSIFKIGLFTNKAMVLCIIGTLLIQAIVIFTPSIAELLKIVLLPRKLYIIIGITCVVSVVILEVIKLVLSKIFVKNKE